jgi:hypothetical protein
MVLPYKFNKYITITTIPIIADAPPTPHAYLLLVVVIVTATLPGEGIENWSPTQGRQVPFSGLILNPGAGANTGASSGSGPLQAARILAASKLARSVAPKGKAAAKRKASAKSTVAAKPRPRVAPPGSPRGGSPCRLGSLPAPAAVDGHS